MNTTLTKLSAIKRNPNNPRVLQDEKLVKLVKSIKDFPQMLEIRPIVVNDDMVVLGGNMRLKACKEAGLTEVPVIKASDFTEDQQREFIIKDNVGFGEWDWDLLANEWDTDLLEDWGLELDFDPVDDNEGLTDEDDVPEVTEEPVSKVGDIWLLGEHRVMCGDSTSTEAIDLLMNGKTANMVFTDPPYNIDYQGVSDKREKIKNDKMPDEDFVKFLYSSIMPSDTMYVCCSWQYAHLFKEAMEMMDRKPKAMIVWNKVNPAQHLDKYYKQHEIIFYYGKFGGQKTLRGDIWEVKRQKNTVHPTMKPIELIEMALSDQTDKKLIYDGFLGSGSTLIASEKKGRKCYGMELDPKYVDVIVKRWQEYTGKKAIHAESGERFVELEPYTTCQE
jgi:DNA modification methylase